MRLPTKFIDYTGLPYLLQNQNVVNTVLTTEESTSLPSVSDIQPVPALTEPLYYKQAIQSTEWCEAMMWN